ncbi:MAG TPA: SDR family oxidoreductase [Acidobacteria bacterium]|nr:SDR family oxidoreductase [Acidobacteriota bacterium]
MTNVPAFEGRTAIVTGGSRGIGLATAAALRSTGANVLICGRSADALAEAVDRLRADSASGGLVTSAKVDVGEPNQAERLIRTAVDEMGGLDILINNAGVGRFAPLAELSDEDWRETLDTNLSGAFYCCRAAIPVMRSRGHGWIINVSSLAGQHPFAGGAAYCASKAALNALTESLMQEVRQDHIRVSCVVPGSVDTRFGGRGPGDESSWKLAATDVAQTIVDLLRHPPRSLPSRVELRPSMPRK